MKVSEVIKLADNIRGSYVDLGFGKGVHSKEIFKLMLDGSIAKRESIYIDLFNGGEEGIWQTAHDLVNEVKNRLSLNAKYSRTNVHDGIDVPKPVALVNLDLGDINLIALKQILPKMPTDGIVLLREYSQDIENYISNLNSATRLVRLDNFSYIIKKSLERNTNIKRTRSVLT